MNRQAKRQMAKSGMDKPRPAAERREAAAQAARTKERTGPRQYLSEVRGEMKKVAWPTRAEVKNSTIIVLVAVVFMAVLIFGYDFLSAKSALWLFD
jgi:preprotein translocase subunit SecE